jgi:transcriptional regulator with GAF, ATPase, and Fis domain
MGTKQEAMIGRTVPVNTDASALQRRIEELEEIHRLAQSLSSMVGVYETLQAIIDSCLKLCKAERGAILLFSTAANESPLTVVRNDDQERGGIDHNVNTFVAGWIGSHNRPFLTDDVLQELNFRNPSERIKQLGASMAVPLVEAGKPFGMIHLVNSRGASVFKEEQVRLVSALVPLAAQFILRAKIQETIFADNQRLKASLQQAKGVGTLLGGSRVMEEVRSKIMIAGPSNASVLLMGATGTGKEVAARAIHVHSPRAEKPFIAVNCAAIPSSLFESELFGHEKGSFTGATATMKGKFELADGGTLFLDEISALPMELQPKLLRVLEERSFCRVGSSEEHKVDVRVISASNTDLQRAIKANQFRDDLFHRLNVIPLQLPTLSERKEDIAELAQSFISEFSSGAKSFAGKALQFLSSLEWKGNVRELRNTVERISIFVSSSSVSAADVRNVGIGAAPPSSADAKSLLLSILQSKSGEENLVEQFERDLIDLALQQSHGNAAEAARMLGVHRNALLRRIEKYNLR